MSSTMASLGTYRPLDTPVHRMDAKVKIVLIIALMVAIFIPYGNPAHSMYPYAMDMFVGACIFIGIAVLAGLARTPFTRILRTLGKMWFLILVVVVLNLFLYRPSDSFLNQNVLFYCGSYPVYETALWYAGYVVERLVLTIISTLVVVSATSPMDLSNALEQLLSPLKLLKVPVAAFSMMMSLALRFIPLLSSEAERIRKAQAARGLDSSNGSVGERFRALIGLFIPLLAISFLDAVNVAEAMEARGYDPKAKRTRYHSSAFRPVDWVWLFLFLALLAGALFLCCYRVDGLRLDVFAGV